MYAYIGRTFQAAHSNSVIKDVTCEKCSCAYHYRMVRRGTGSASAPYYIAQEAARLRAERRAIQQLNKRLKKGVDPVACPECGWFQSDMVWELRRRKHRWLMWTGVGFGILFAFALLIWLLDATKGFERELKESDKTVMMIMAGALIVSFVGPMLLRSLLLKATNPNRAHPQKPNPIPGAPIPFRDGDEEDVITPVPAEAADGVLSYQTRPPEVERGGWITVQLLGMPMPRVCCRCLAEADRVSKYRYGSTVDIPLRVCGRCNKRENRRLIFWAVGTVVALNIAAATLVYLASRKLDGGDFIAGAVVATLIGAGIGWLLGKVMSQPASFKSFDSALNTIRIRFKNQNYASIFLANRPPPKPASVMPAAIAIPRPVRR